MAITISTLCLSALLAGCGKVSVSGVYEHKQDRRGYDRRGDIVVFGESRTLDFRSNGSFVFTYGPGQAAQGYSGGSREVTTGRWKMSDGKIVCYNGDGSVFSTLSMEGADLISGEIRYRKK